MMELMRFVDAVTDPNGFQRQVCNGRDSIKGKSKHGPGKGIACLMGGVCYAWENTTEGEKVLKQRINPFRALPNSPRPAASPSQPHGR